MLYVAIEGKPGVIIRLNVRNNKSINNLIITSTSIRLLDLWIIEKEYFTPFNYKLIVFKWLDLNLN